MTGTGWSSGHESRWLRSIYKILAFSWINAQKIACFRANAAYVIKMNLFFKFLLKIVKKIKSELQENAKIFKVRPTFYKLQNEPWN